MMIIELTPKKSPLCFDVMIGGRFYRSVRLNVSVGVKYTIDELKSFARMKLPSLKDRDFELWITTEPVFKS